MLEGLFNKGILRKGGDCKLKKRKEMMMTTLMIRPCDLSIDLVHNKI